MYGSNEKTAATVKWKSWRHLHKTHRWCTSYPRLTIFSFSSLSSLAFGTCNLCPRPHQPTHTKLRCKHGDRSEELRHALPSQANNHNNTTHLTQIANQPCNTVELAPAPNSKYVHHRRVRSRSLRSRYKNTRNPYGINRRAIKYQIGQERICTETPEHRGRIRYCSLSLSIKPNSTYRFAKNSGLFLRWCQDVELFFVIYCGSFDGESHTHTRIRHHDPLPRRPPGSPISLALITSAIRTAKCYVRFFRYSLQRVKIYIIYATESHPT